MITFRKPQTAQDSPEQFIDELKSVWPRVERFTVSRMHKGEPVFMGNADVTHLEGEDSPHKDVKELRVYLEDDARNRSQATRYQVVAIGSKKGAKAAKNQPPNPDIADAELASWTPRFGDGDTTGNERDPIAQINAFLKAVPDIYSGSMVAADASLKISAGVNVSLMGENNALRAENTALRAERDKGDQWRFELAKLQVSATQAERADTRDENRYQEARADAVAQAAALENQKSQVIEMAKGAIQEIIVIVKEEAKERRRAKARDEGREPEPETPDPEPAANESGTAAQATIPTALAAALQGLTSEAHEKLVEIFGRTHAGTDPVTLQTKAGYSIWEIIVGASKAPDDNKAMDVLDNIDHGSPDDVARVNAAFKTATDAELLTKAQANAIIKHGINKIGSRGR